MSEEKRLDSGDSSTMRPKRIAASYGFGKFNYEFVSMAFGLFVIYFYKEVVLLDPFLLLLGYLIFTGWNMFNDPIMGHLTSRPTRFASKWGRRFPWIVFSVIPWGITYGLLFSPPDLDPVSNQWVYFAWMTIFLCLNDTFVSIWDVNYQSIFPDKFPSQKERRTAAGIATLVGILGIALGAIIPPLIVTDERSSYASQGWVTLIIIIAAFFLMLPGVREDRGMIDRYVKSVEDLKGKEPTFLQNLKEVFKQKNFLAFVLLYMLYQACTLSVQASIKYIVENLLGSGSVTLISAGFLIGALVTIPLWMWLAHKLQNNQRMIMIGAVLMMGFMVPMIFPQTYTMYIVLSTLWGTGLGLFWAMTGPVMADVIDEYVVQTKKRREGMMFGFRAFFGRLAYGIQVITIILIQVSTGFQSAKPPIVYPIDSLPAIGIRMHLALFPIIFLIIGVLIYWKMNTLTPEKMKDIKRQLAELNL